MKLALVGATGEVGRTALKVLEERGFPAANLILLASPRSAGTAMAYAGESLIVEDVALFDPSRAQVAVFSAGSDVAREQAPRFVAGGCTVVDNSSQFRYDDDKLLIVPEVNGERLAELDGPAIVANPNCSTIQIVVALQPMARAAGLARVNVCTYQAVSGAGRKGIAQLEAELAGEEPTVRAFQKPIAGNVIPHIDRFEENGYTREEMKVVRETRKIMGLPELPVNCTAVRVPVLNGHSAAVHLETERPLSVEDAKAALRSAPGIVLVVDGDYPTPKTDADGVDPVLVGRVRADVSHPRGLCFWVVADNLRKGAATNAVQIAEQWAVERRNKGFFSKT